MPKSVLFKKKAVRISCVRDLEFKCQAGQILFSVANGLPLRKHLFLSMLLPFIYFLC